MLKNVFIISQAHQDVSATALEYIQAEVERESCDGSYHRRLIPLYDTLHLEVTGNEVRITRVHTIILHFSWF